MPKAQGLLGIKPGIILNTALTNINNTVVINNTLTVTSCLPTLFCQIVLFYQTKLRTLSCPVRPSITDVVEPFH